MFSTIILLVYTYIQICQSKQFAKELFAYNISHTFHGRIVESIIVPNYLSDIAYISFSEQRVPSKDMQDVFQNRIDSNPMVAKISFKGDAIVEWNTSLADSPMDTRFTSMALSSDGTQLFVTGTLVDRQKGHKFYIQTINAELGVLMRVIFISELPGSQIIERTAADERGVYVCGRSTNDSLTEPSIENVDHWEFLLGGILFLRSKSIFWRYSRNIRNRTCDVMHLSRGYLYTAGTKTSRMTFGSVYKHTIFGDMVWEKRVSTQDLPVKPVSIIRTYDGIFLSSGLEASAESRDRVILQKLSERGTLLWTRRIGKSVNGYSVGGLGYRYGFVYGFVSRGVNGITLGRMSRFGDVDDVQLGIESSSDVISVWSEDKIVVVESGSPRVWAYVVGTDAVRVVDSKHGNVEYRVEMSMSVNEDDLERVEDYIREASHDGSVSMIRTISEEGLISYDVLVGMHADSTSTLEGYVEKLKRLLEAGADGKNELERTHDIVNTVKGEIVVKNVNIHLYNMEGGRSRFAIFAVLLIGLGAFISFTVALCYINVSRRE